MKKLLLFSPLIVLAILILFIATNSKTDAELEEQNKKVLNEIKEIIPNAKKIIIGKLDDKDKEKDKEYVYSYQNKRYIIIKEVTAEEEVEKIKTQMLEYEIPEETSDITLSDVTSPFLLVLLDKDDNKIAETDLYILSTSKSNKVNVINNELSSDIYKYHEEYRDSKNKNE